MHQEEDCSVSTEDKASIVMRKLKGEANYGVYSAFKELFAGLVRVISIGRPLYRAPG